MLGLRVVCVSDTHGIHEELGELPNGDLLIHAGDFTKFGKKEHLYSFKKWLDRQIVSKNYQHCVVVNGNHESNAQWKNETKTVLESKSENSVVQDDGSGAKSEHLLSQEDGGSVVDSSVDTTRGGKISFLKDELLEIEVTCRSQTENDEVEDVLRRVRIFGTQFYWPMRKKADDEEEEDGAWVKRPDGTWGPKPADPWNALWRRFFVPIGDRFDKNPGYDLIPRPANTGESGTGTATADSSTTASQTPSLNKFVRGVPTRHGNSVAKSNKSDSIQENEASSGSSESSGTRDTGDFWGVDLLVTHGPARGRVDGGLGCGDLARAIREVRPRAVISGHIHRAHGIVREGRTRKKDDGTIMNSGDATLYVNAAICGEHNKKGWDCVVVDI